MKKNTIILTGIFFSIAINIAINFKNGHISINKSGIFLSMTLPFILATFFTAITAVIKIMLFEGPSFQKWDCKEATYILKNDKSIIKKSLAKIYLLVDFPTLFFAGYMVGCSFFLIILIFSKK